MGKLIAIVGDYAVGKTSSLRYLESEHNIKNFYVEADYGDYNRWITLLRQFVERNEIVVLTDNITGSKIDDIRNMGAIIIEVIKAGDRPRTNPDHVVINDMTPTFYENMKTTFALCL